MPESAGAPPDPAVEAVAAELARQHGLAGSVELIRSGSNHVYRIGEVVLRLTPVPTAVPDAVALAERLASEGLPVLRALEDFGVVGAVRASLWEYVDPASGGPVDFEALGRALARLHAVDPRRLDDVVALGWYADPDWLRLEDNLERAAATGIIDTAGIAELRRRCAAMRGWASLDPDEPVVVCHGDVHPDNVLMRGGQPLIIDWDLITVGPPAWDHAALLTWPERWGGGPDDYRSFARGYGTDLSDDPLARRLADVRLLGPTINMVIRGAANATCAAEARLRMRYWLGDPDAPQWTGQ